MKIDDELGDSLVQVGLANRYRSEVPNRQRTRNRVLVSLNPEVSAARAHALSSAGSRPIHIRDLQMLETLCRFDAYRISSSTTRSTLNKVQQSLSFSDLGRQVSGALCGSFDESQILTPDV
jgi:hypothetical protein